MPLLERQSSWQGFIQTRLHQIQERLLYAPIRPLLSNPREAGMPYEIVQLTTLQGEKIQGWFIPSRVPGAPVLLYCHGTAGNISCHVNLSYFFRYLGLSVFVFDYRGYGQSEGKPSELALYADAEAAWQYLTGVQGFAPDTILLWGHSLGASVALELAIHHPEARGLVLEGAFTSILDMARLNPWFRPLPLERMLRDRFDNRARISQLRLPVAVVHGTADEVVPYAMGEELFAQAPPPKRLWTVAGGRHNKLWAELGVAKIRELLAATTKHSISQML